MPVYFPGQNIVSGRQDQGTVVSNVIEEPPPAIEGEYLTPDSASYYVSPDGSEYYQQPS